MRVIIDQREADLYDKCDAYDMALSKPSYAVISKDVLHIGDVLIQNDEEKDVLLIERKTFSDLLASIKDGRYEEQSYRLLNSSGFPPHSVIYLIEGMFSQLRSPLEKKIIYSAITTLQYFKGFSVYKTSSVAESAEWIMTMADKIERNFLKNKVPYYLTEPFRRYFTPQNENQVLTETEMSKTSAEYCTVVKKVKKDNITRNNIGEIILCQIPGISSTTAMAIMEQYADFYSFYFSICENPEIMKEITLETNGKKRKISKKVVESIHQYLLPEFSEEQEENTIQSKSTGSPLSEGIDG